MSAPAPTEITVIATSDLHAHWQSPGGGIRAVIAALGDYDRARTVIIDNGDLLTGSVLGATLADQIGKPSHPVIAALDAAGFDVGVPGNHDFDHGAERLRETLSSAARMQFVLANCVDAADESFLPPSTIVVRAGVRVAVIGVVTGHVQRLSRYSAVHAVRFTDPVAAVRREVSRLRGDADLVIVAYHGGFSVDPRTGERMHYDTGEDEAERLLALDGVDGVIAGHQHEARSGIAHGTAYVQPGYAGSHLGLLRFTVTRTEQPTVSRRDAELRALAGVDADRAPLGLAAQALAVADEQAQRAALLPCEPDDLFPHSDDAIACAVAKRCDLKAVALALPPAPRSRAQISAALPSPVGAVTVRLSRVELESALVRARVAEGTVVVQGIEPDDEHPTVVINQALLAHLPEGRVVAAHVVDWLDEFTALALGRMSCSADISSLHHESGTA